jgi:hypothetical protein
LVEHQPEELGVRGSTPRGTINLRRSMKYLLVLVFSIFLCSCTQQDMAKEFGGKVTVTLPEGKRLVEATWKDSDLWYLLEDRKPDQAPRVLQFVESGSWGLMNGTVTFVEK